MGIVTNGVFSQIAQPWILWGHQKDKIKTAHKIDYYYYQRPNPETTQTKTRSNLQTCHL